jgi:diguanylate cyclase (GGDEF)-like protein
MYTGIVFNKNREVVSILHDGLSLYPRQEIIKFKEIVPGYSEELLSQFFTRLSELGWIMDLLVEIIQENRSRKVYFSGILWMDYYFVCISEEEGYCKFLYLKEQSKQSDKEGGLNNTDDVHVEELNEISRLNNELVEIQRELTKKNLNLELLNQRLEELATTDPLTGIFNRRAVFERVRLEINRSLREKSPCGLAILDLDDFKKINDQFGHLMGDDALKITSMCLRHSTRKYDVAGRIGGDEFLVFFSVDSKKQFKKILDRLLAEINKHTMDISGELTIRIKTSIGGVFFDTSKQKGELGINRLIKKADDALYNAKDRGGNIVMVQEI